MHPTIPLIELKNIEKVFLTDELETHALTAVRIRHRNSVHKEGLP
jgi:hypothetical protein